MHFTYACKIVITKLSVTELLGTIFSARDRGEYCVLDHESVFKIEEKNVAVFHCLSNLLTPLSYRCGN